MPLLQERWSHYVDEIRGMLVEPVMLVMTLGFDKFDAVLRSKVSRTLECMTFLKPHSDARQESPRGLEFRLSQY